MTPLLGGRFSKFLYQEVPIVKYYNFSEGKLLGHFFFFMENFEQGVSQAPFNNFFNFLALIVVHISGFHSAVKLIFYLLSNISTEIDPP